MNNCFQGSKGQSNGHVVSPGGDSTSSTSSKPAAASPKASKQAAKSPAPATKSKPAPVVAEPTKKVSLNYIL